VVVSNLAGLEHVVAQVAEQPRGKFQLALRAIHGRPDGALDQVVAEEGPL
jgi:hypothetical protein